MAFLSQKFGKYVLTDSFHGYAVVIDSSKDCAALYVEIVNNDARGNSFLEAKENQFSNSVTFVSFAILDPINFQIIQSTGAHSLNKVTPLSYLTT